MLAMAALNYIDKFKSKLYSINWIETIKTYQNYKSFNKILNHILNECIPKQIIKIRNTYKNTG